MVNWTVQIVSSIESKIICHALQDKEYGASSKIKIAANIQLLNRSQTSLATSNEISSD